MKLDEGKLQEASGRLYLGTKESRQRLRNIRVLVGIEWFDAVERGTDLLLKPISLVAHHRLPSA